MRDGKAFEAGVAAFEDDGFDAGDEELGFGGEMAGDFVIRMRVVAGEEFINGTFAVVVGSEGETPVVKVVVEEAEVLGGGGGGGIGLITLVAGPEGQAVAFGRVGHQLKQTGCAHRAAGGAVEGGFDFGEPDEFGRDVLCGIDAFELADVLAGGAGAGAVGEFFGPEFALRLRGELKGRRRRGVGAVLRRRDGEDADFVGDVEVVNLHGEPLGVGLEFLAALEDGQDGLGGLLEAGEVEDVGALKTLADTGEELFDGVFVQFGECVEINVVVDPILGALDEVGSGGVGLGASRGRQK